MITNNCCNHECVDWEWKLFWMTWLFWGGNTMVEQLWSNECSRKTMSLESQVVPVMVPLSVGGTAPFFGKASAGPTAKWGASQDQVSLPAPSTCSSPEIWHDLFGAPGMSPPSDAEVFCKTLFALYRTSLQRPSAHCDNEGSFFYQVWVWSAAIPSAN